VVALRAVLAHLLQDWLALACVFSLSVAMAEPTLSDCWRSA